MNVIGKDCCGQDIVPVPNCKLDVRTNRHRDSDGCLWGWIDGCTKNIVWSNGNKFNESAATDLVNLYNSTVVKISKR